MSVAAPDVVDLSWVDLDAPVPCQVHLLVDGPDDERCPRPAVVRCVVRHLQGGALCRSAPLCAECMDEAREAFAAYWASARAHGMVVGCRDHSRPTGAPHAVPL